MNARCDAVLEASRPAQGLRVVMIAPTPFFSDRGCHVRILEEARGLERAGAQVTVCTYFLGDTPSDLDVRRTFRLPGYRKRSAGPSWGKLLLDAGLLRLTRRVVRERAPHVLHAHLHEGIGIASRVGGDGVVRVLDVQGGLAQETLDHNFLPDVAPIRWTLEGIEGVLARRGDLVVTSHTPAARTLVERFRVPARRVRVVGDAGTLSPVDADLARSYRERWDIDPGDPIVLYTGLLGHHQGTNFLFDVAEALRDRGGPGKVLVLGYPEAGWKREVARRDLEKNMVFAGRFPYEHFSSLLSLGWIALSPKMSVTEGNQKLFAYLEAGLPVVAFGTPATREVLGDAGVVVPRADGCALARTTLDLLADEERRSALGRVARRRASELGGWDAVVARILDAYRAAGVKGIGSA